MRYASLLIAFWLLASSSVQAADSADPDLASSLNQAMSALAADRYSEAISQANEVLARVADEPMALYIRGAAYAELGKADLAMTDLDRSIALTPQAVLPYLARASVYLTEGRIEDAITDYEKSTELRPQGANRLWQLGIAYYFAGRYADSRRQFEAYQTIDDNDVENVTWRYLGMARELGVERAREALLDVRDDPRIPLMAIHALYRGKASEDDVLEAAREGEPDADELRTRLFYAHLYMGLHREAAGDEVGALEHLAKSAEDYAVSMYMARIARMHVQRLRNDAKETPGSR